MRALLALCMVLLLPTAWAESWTSAHAEPENDRSVASLITPANVAHLERAWRVPARASVTGTPLHDGVNAYFADWSGQVVALRLADGKRLWSADVGARVDASLALSGSSVLVPDASGNLTALDRASGKRLWATWVEPMRGTHLWGAPSVVGSRIFIGMASEQTDLLYDGAQDFRGGVACLDLGTGNVLWKTYFQEEGAHGVSVWSTPAIDAKRGLLFVGSGNAYGAPAGTLSDSIVALRMADGSVAWRFQATSGDAFDARGSPGPDADFGASPMLFHAGARDVVGDGDKAGRFYALDRDTGELVWNRTVDFVPEGATPAEKEGFLGTGAFANGTLFLPTTSRSMVHALDAATGKPRWAVELNARPTSYGERMFGSTTVTNGVVLQGNAFGQLYALDARDGRTLAVIDVGGDVQGGVSVAGDTLLVPDAGGVLWDEFGNLTAYRLPGSAVPKPSPTASPPPTPSAAPTATPTRSELPPVVVHEAPAADSQSQARVPGVGLLGAFSVAFAAASIRSRRPRR